MSKEEQRAQICASLEAKLAKLHMAQEQVEREIEETTVMLEMLESSYS
jgi:hypothetical protein